MGLRAQVFGLAFGSVGRRGDMFVQGNGTRRLELKLKKTFARPCDAVVSLLADVTINCLVDDGTDRRSYALMDQCLDRGVGVHDRESIGIGHD